MPLCLKRVNSGGIKGGLGMDIITLQVSIRLDVNSNLWLVKSGNKS